MIEEPPLLTIRRQFERTPAALVARFANMQTGHLVDAMDGRGALDRAVKPVDRAQAAFVGTAVTCETGPSDNLAILGALSLAGKGDVIIAAAEGFMGAAIVGDNVAAMARNRGVVAMVTDGVVRDTPGLIAVGLPMFAAGVTPNSCNKSGPGRVGFPIVVGGVAVEPGDVVLGDVDGVVVVPRARAEQVLARLDQVLQAEAALQARIAAGLTQFEAIEALLRSDRVRYVE